jgi:Spy/CpxP family protein refolding chaperone
MPFIVIVMVLAALPVLVVFAALTPSKPPPATPHRATCCEFVSDGKWQQSLIDAQDETEADRERRRKQLNADVAREMWIKKIHDEAESYRPPPPCGSLSNPCHVTMSP